MKNYTKISFMDLVQTALVVLLLISSNASAGAPLEAEKRVEVSLHGVTRFGGVQLFEYLLGEIPRIVILEQTRSLLVTDEPEKCKAAWVVQMVNGNGVDLLEEVNSILKALDPDMQNEVLYDAPFIVMKEDLELLKRVTPLQSTESYAAFSVDGLVANWEGTNTIEGGGVTVPWYMSENRGFE